MTTISEIADDILRREGGFVNDPSDPGGATNFGVTIHTMRRLGIDLNRDGVVDVDDVKLLTQDRAKQIFLDHYYRKPKIDQLPESLQASVFDMYVNSGGNAVKILQRLLRKMGFEVSVDGALGPQTLGAARKAHDINSFYFVNAYAVERRNYYYSLADGRPKSRKYARTRNGGKGGWIKRAEEFMHPQFRYSDLQHLQRTESWG